MSSIRIKLGDKESLASGSVIFPANERLTLELEDGGDVAVFDFVFKTSAESSLQPQVNVRGISPSHAEFTFLNTPAGLGTSYESIRLGTINGKLLTADFNLKALGALIQLDYSFWLEMEARSG